MTLVSLEHLLPFPLQLFFAFLLGIALGVVIWIAIKKIKER